MVEASVLKEQCSRTLLDTDFPEFGERLPGKVRDAYLQPGRRLLLATDRISAFDVIVGTIPFKGQLLNQLAAFWFERTRMVARNHLLAVPDPAVSVVRECRVMPVEFVVRGYLAGVSDTSIWTAYARGEREYCGHRLPEGLRKNDRLPEPILTPTTKAPRGQHDELASRAGLLAEGVISETHFDAAERLALELFAEGTAWAEKQGLILVDTKYEIGLDPEGELCVVDEIHTSDSSRYWRVAGYEQSLEAATDPKALDKEYVRSWLVDRGYRGDGEPPELPEEVRCEAARRYIEAYEWITGGPFEPSLEEPESRIRKNLKEFSSKKI